MKSQGVGLTGLLTATARHISLKAAGERDLSPIACLLVWTLCLLMLLPPETASALRLTQAPETPDSTQYLDAEILVREPHDRIPVEADTVAASDTAMTVVVDENSPYGLDGKIPFNPDPTRAVWLSALFPGLGQIYNRRYWKLPIVVAGFMGLAYGTSWNNGQLRDYTQAYRDLLDNDPASNSYMNFFPPTTNESDLDKTWLTSTMRSRRDYYRRNRDLCIICLVGLYLICMVDAYVDASLAHFDITPDLSMDVAPAVILPSPSEGRKVSLGLNWAINF